jgi:hypothetical protein
MSAWIVALGTLCSSALTPNCVRHHPTTYDGALCLSDIKMLDAFSDTVWLSDMHELNVLLNVQQEHAELIHFASTFGLTFCYEQGRVFLPNTVRELF